MRKYPSRQTVHIPKHVFCGIRRSTSFSIQEAYFTWNKGVRKAWHLMVLALISCTIDEMQRKQTAHRSIKCTVRERAGLQMPFFETGTHSTFFMCSICWMPLIEVVLSRTRMALSDHLMRDFLPTRPFHKNWWEKRIPCLIKSLCKRNSVCDRQRGDVLRAFYTPNWFRQSAIKRLRAPTGMLTSLKLTFSRIIRGDLTVGDGEMDKNRKNEKKREREKWIQWWNKTTLKLLRSWYRYIDTVRL